LAWAIEYTPKAVKALSKLDKTSAARIVAFMQERTTEDPRNAGKALSGPLGEFWRYRVGDYRILTKIEDSRLVVLVVQVSHRSAAYR